MLKKQLFIFVIGFIFISCNDKKNENEKYLPASGGTINHLTVVADDALWNGETGDVVRDIFATSIIGMPQEEPMFTLKQMPSKAFHEFVKKSRTFIELKKSDSTSISFVKDVYATPQLGIVVSGKDTEALNAILQKNASKMLAKFRGMEIKHKIAEMAKNPIETDAVLEVFGIDLNLLFSYRVAKQTDNFMWLRKDIKNGDMNLMIYQLPYRTIKRDSTTIDKIVNVRDSIGKIHIPGPVKNSYMITEKSYTPYLGTTIINGQNVLETKGIWDVKNDYMAGPFINYIIDDKKNNRQLVLEGFTYAPQIPKRDYMFELEAIIKSIQIQ